MVKTTFVQKACKLHLGQREGRAHSLNPPLLVTVAAAESPPPTWCLVKNSSLDSTPSEQARAKPKES